MSFETVIPVMIKKRLERLTTSEDNVVREAAAATPVPITVPLKYWAKQLHTSVDSVGPREMQLSKLASRKVESGTGLQHEASFIQAIKICQGIVSTPNKVHKG